MRLLSSLTFAAALIAGAASAADLKIDHPWARPAAAGANSAGYIAITNTGSAAEKLLSASSPAAARVEMHRSMVMNGMAMMHPAPEGVAIPPGTTAVFAPGGYHIMLIGLKQALKVGDKLPVTLTFQKAGKIETSFTVETGVR